jgi:hypothetical protein
MIGRKEDADSIYVKVIINQKKKISQIEESGLMSHKGLVVFLSGDPFM